MNPIRHRNDWLLLTALGIVLIVIEAWLVRAAGVDLHYDEAQYWEWSRQLDWSYYSKGPLIAWLITLSEALFGQGSGRCVSPPGWPTTHCYF